MELELAFTERSLQTSDELAPTEDTPDTLTGRKKDRREPIHLEL
jgi:hypothetical protein